MTTEMKMETRSLASLRPAEYNPRVQLQPADPEYQNIKRSIETFGYVDPIIVNQDGTIIGGHQRYNVMKDLGYTEAQVVVVDLDKNNEKALNIALNKITGEWDEIKLKDLLLDLDLNDYDLTATGFSSKEVEDLVIRLDKDVEAEDDNFDADADYESIEEPVTQRAFRDAGFKLAECLIWEKSSFVLGRQDYQWRHEPILYGWKEGAAHYFIDDRSQDTILLEDELDLESMKKEDLITYINQIIAQYKDQTTVLFEKKPTKNDVHPTMKPVNLVGRLMRNSSKPGWNVLDLFGGSGSTLMAAEQIGRRAFLMELDEKFCDVIVHRWEEFTGKKAVRAGKLEVSL